MGAKINPPPPQKKKKKIIIIIIIIITLGLPTKPKKIPGPKNKHSKILCWTSEPLNFPEKVKWSNTKNKLDIECLCLRLGYAGTTMSIQIVLNDRKNPYLNQATQKIIAKFSYWKKFENKKFHTQKLLQSSPSLEIISSEIISEYPPPPPPSGEIAFLILVSWLPFIPWANIAV